MASMLDRKQFEKDHLIKNFPKMEPFNMTYHGQKIERITNVWLDIHDKEQFVQNIGMYTDEKTNVPAIGEQKGPGLIYISAGAWFTHNHVITAGIKGLENWTDPWEERYDLYKNHVISLSNLVGDNTPEHDPFTAPMDPYDGIGNQIFYAPPAGPRYLGDEPERKMDRDRRADEVIDMQQWLHDNEDKMSIPLMWSIPGLVVGQDKIWRDPLRTGFHVKFHVAKLRANILFNMRCNAKLDRIKPYPYSRTCCTDYGIKTFTQLALVYLGTVYLIMMAKGSKLWQLKDFIALSFAWIAVLIFTIRRSDSVQDSYSMQPVTDQPFLSRDQMDEWKGWMQCLILTYHWTGAQGSSIDTLFHLCVCGYLFQVGYNNTLYYMSEGDFSFNHVAATLLRLNLLPCFLSYFMDTDYMFYYISPLLSFWFLVVYATMAISGNRNNDVQFLLAKICISLVLVSTIQLATPLTHWTFHILKGIFKVQWNDKEWQYHITMNTFIVYIGMLAAIMYREMKNAKITIHRGLRISLALGSLLAICHYLYVAPTLERDAYEKWYPYISAIPTLAFLVLRNVSTSARNHYSKAMAWLGRCHVETYILQAHLLLAADNNGILIVDGLFGDGTLLGDRWRTLVVLVPIFLWLSHAVADSTAYIVKLILHESASSGKTGWLGRFPGCSNITTPQIRILCILLIMWCLNLMTPGHEIPAAPNGGHKLSIVKDFPKQRPSLAPLNGTMW
ncbi:putative o-acetyltransferase cas1 [Fusarium flagelliforme]|uniref:Putative o-acetyltransferase cas1 n=1 Tax=Fusarium flagelliforme TaxID=2675880 RepID=A0A395MS09_9HYPO|nr:putative o-acetyltransferase cas1 [Fusarium flagelliforme]